MVADVTALLGEERGSAFDDHNLLFATFDDGGIFNYDAAHIHDINQMLDRDGKARTLELALSLPIRRASTAIRRGPAKTKVAKFVEEKLFAAANNGGMSTSMNLVVSQMCGAMVHRKAFFEKVFVTDDDGKLKYDKMAWRPPATCTVKRDKRTGAFEGFVQNPIRIDNLEPVHFKPMHSFVYIHGTHRNPLDGVSDMSVPYWCYITKQKIRFLWYSFLEGQALPKTVVKARTQPEADRGARKVLGLRSGGVIGITDQIDLDTLESSGKGAGQFKEALQWLDSESSGSVLAGFTDLGGSAANGTGSFALSKDQTDFFLMSRQAVATEMADALNQYVIPDLVRWNFGLNEPCPAIEFGPIAEDDAQMAITLLQATSVTESPVLPREFMEELIERVAGFLNLDTNKVREGLVRAAEEAQEKAEAMGIDSDVPGVAGAVDAATKMVQNMQNPPPPPAPPQVAQFRPRTSDQRPRPPRGAA